MNYQLIAPEILLAFTASLLLGLGVSRTKNRAPLIRNVAIALLLLYAVLGFLLGNQTGTVFNGSIISDSYSHYLKFFLGVAGAGALVLSKSFLETEKLDLYEFSILLMYAVLGMGIMVSSNSLLALYIGVEMQSLALYVMAAFNRDSLRASEAGLKYFVLGALSSGLLLYGISMIYGFTGTLNFDAIATSIADKGAGSGVIAGMVFILCGLGFKISAAPFHMWTPDVYEGAPTPVTAFFAGAPKFAAIALIARLLMEPFGAIEDQWQQVIIVLSVLSMTIGAIGALQQTNIKRLMAYSSIANLGYALVPLAAGGQAGLKGMLIFMSIYVLSVIGVFACILQMRIRDGMVEQLSDLAGLSKTNRPLALLMSGFMLSLMGIPPLLGFFGKWFAFAPVFQSGPIWLGIYALVMSVIAAAYYLRIVKIMWFDETDREFVKAPHSLRAVSSLSGLLIILLVFPFAAIPAQGWIEQAAASLF